MRGAGLFLLVSVFLLVGCIAGTPPATDVNVDTPIVDDTISTEDPLVPESPAPADDEYGVEGYSNLNRSVF